MAKKPTTAPRSSAPTVVRDESSELDFGDVALGLTAAIVLPVIAYFTLDLVGLPVGGTAGFNSEQADQFRQVRNEVPPMTVEEAQYILQRVQYLVDDRAKDFVSRSRRTDDNQEKSFWQDLAKGVLGPAESSLKKVTNEESEHHHLPDKILDATQQWLKKVDSLRFELAQEDPFRHVR